MKQSTAEIEYLTSGWKEEAIGTKQVVDLKRLKVAVESLSHFRGAPQLVQAYVRRKRNDGLFSDSLADGFLQAWYMPVN